MSIPPAAPPGRSRSRSAAGLPAVTAGRIVDAAMKLTAEQGLENWTLRQLAAAVDAYPAVVYHHVGDREAVVKAVIEQVLERLPLPAADLPWRDWFSRMLEDLRLALRHYPGSARRVELLGLAVRPAAKIIDRGVRTLQRAGFGAESPLVYNVVMCTACQFIAMEDDSDADQPARLAAARGFLDYKDRADLPGASAMASEAFEACENPERARGYYGDMYDYAISRCLDGLSVRLAEIRAEAGLPRV
jgi:AcrR family transcriptional regulator